MKNLRTAILFTIIAAVILMTALVGVASSPNVKGAIMNNKQPYKTSIWTDKKSYSAGEKMSISFSVEEASYAYVFSVDDDGVVRMIFPNIHSDENKLKANQIYSIPDNGRYTMTAPGTRGTVQLVLIATPKKIKDTGWLASSLSNNNFAPQINININADTFLVQIKSISLNPTFDDDWSSAYVTFLVSSAASPPEPPRVNSIIITPPVVTPHVTYNGGLHITSSPSGAKVFLNGNAIGNTPMSVNNLNYGDYEVTLVLPGYYTFKDSVVINGPYPQQISAVLSRI